MAFKPMTLRRANPEPPLRLEWDDGSFYIDLDLLADGTLVLPKSRTGRLEVKGGTGDWRALAISPSTWDASGAAVGVSVEPTYPAGNTNWTAGIYINDVVPANAQITEHESIYISQTTMGNGAGFGFNAGLYIGVVAGATDPADDWSIYVDGTTKSFHRGKFTFGATVTISDSANPYFPFVVDHKGTQEYQSILLTTKRGAVSNYGGADMLIGSYVTDPAASVMIGGFYGERYGDGRAAVGFYLHDQSIAGASRYGLSLVTDGSVANLSILSSPTNPAAVNFQGGDNIIFIGNRVTLPTGNPAGGGFLMSDGGALKWRGSSGTVTTMAPA